MGNSQFLVGFTVVSRFNELHEMWLSDMRMNRRKIVTLAHHHLSQAAGNERAARSWKLTRRFGIAGFTLTLALLAGCGGSSGSSTKNRTPTPTVTSSGTPTASQTPTPTQSATPTATPTGSPTPRPAQKFTSGSSALLVDPLEQLAFVPLIFDPDPATGNSRIAVINTTVDPTTANAIIGTIVLSHPDLISSIAQDVGDPRGLLIITSGGNGDGGFVDVIDQGGNPIAGSPFAMPKGYDVFEFGPLSTIGPFGQTVYDPVNNQMVISTVDQVDPSTGASLCPAGAGKCTGFVTFNLTTHVFSSIINTPPTNTFAINPFISASNTKSYAIDTSLENTAGSTTVVDLTDDLACTLSDANLDAGPWGASLDSTTNVSTIANDTNLATILNLNGSTFNTTAPCTLNEGGTNPNSLSADVTALAAGAAVNETTHQAFVIDEDNNGVNLIQLPQTPVTQIAAPPTPTQAFLPLDPSTFSWETEGEPMQVAVDSNHNKAYAVNIFGTYMVQIDLTQMQSNPSGIGTQLPLGSCFGNPISNFFTCNNLNGVIFYPLPPAFGQ